VDGMPSEEPVVLLQLHALRGILPILHSSLIRWVWWGRGLLPATRDLITNCKMADEEVL